MIIVINVTWNKYGQKTNFCCGAYCSEMHDQTSVDSSLAELLLRLICCVENLPEIRYASPNCTQNGFCSDDKYSKPSWCQDDWASRQAEGTCFKRINGT